MTLGQLLEFLSGDVGFDLSDDSPDADRTIFIKRDDGTLVGTFGVMIDEDGDIVIGAVE